LYLQAIERCPEAEKELLKLLNSNIGICHLRQKSYDDCIHFTSQAINLDPKFKKAYQNRATALEQSEREDEAL
jgi:tetratricopeptide (TPR) repeat protein